MAKDDKELHKSDKMPLDEFVYATAMQYIRGAEKVMNEKPNWMVLGPNITARGVLTPMTNGDTGDTSIWVDNDEGKSVERSDIPVNLLHLPAGKGDEKPK